MDTWLFPIHNWIDFSNSVLPVLILVAAFMVVRRIRPGKPTVVSVIFGMLFSIAMVFGAQLDDHGSVPFTNMGMWLVILIFGTVMTVLVSGLWQAMEQAGSAVTVKQRIIPEKATERDLEYTGTEQKENRCIKGQKLRPVLQKAGVIFALYFMVFLAVYPGFFVYDAQTEYLEVVTHQFTTHHPLLHVLLLGGLIQVFYKLSGSINIGIAAYILIQMAVLSVIFGYLVVKLKQRGLGKWGQWILTLYLGCCPPLVMFALCSAKDGMFAGMLVLQVLFLQELCRDPEQFFENKIKIIFLTIATVGMMLLRNNGRYAFAVYLFVLLIFLKKRENLFAGKRCGMGSCMCKVVVMGLLSLFLYFGINQGLVAVTHAEDSEHQEILTVPIMQLARAYAYEPDSFTGQQTEQLYVYLPENALERYRPKLSDGVKVSFNNAAYEQDAASFWKLWAQIGVKHPFLYLNAWLMTSYGFWYPDTVIDVYRGNAVFTYVYEDSSYFGYEVEQPGTRESKIPWLNELYRKMSLEVFQQKVPVVSMLFSPGFLFWCMMFGLGFLLNRRENGSSMEAVLPFVLPLLVFLTFLLGPTYLVRYVVFWWVLVPLLAVEIYAILTGGYSDC